jgi:hypothetical protein
MSAKLPPSLLRLSLAGLVGALAFPSDPAAAAPAARPTAKVRPAKAKPARAKGKIKRVELGKAQIERGKVAPIDPTAGPSAGVNVLPTEPGEWSFVLSANTPRVAGGGWLVAHYARDWESNGNEGPGGNIWLSQNRLPNETYVQAKIAVDPAHEYEVTLCTEGSELVRAKVGNSSSTFPAGNSDCDLTLVIKPTEKGIATLMLEFVEPAKENSPNSFNVRRIEVIRR